MRFCDVVRGYRIGRGLSFRSFASELNDYLPMQEKERISHTAVRDWENGLYEPPITKLYWVLGHAPEDAWQRDFAATGMAVIEPVRGSGLEDNTPAPITDVPTDNETDKEG